MGRNRLMPLLILGFAGLIIAALYLGRGNPEDREPVTAAPLVRIVRAAPTTYQFTVQANGSVSPSTESELIPQVSGEVLEVSPALVSGGFFEKGEVLARIDAADYRVDREAARAAVARARSEFNRAEKDLNRQRRLAETSVASESRIDDANNAFKVAEASLREAEAKLERANRDLARTKLTAPYRGRVRTEQVDVGQFVTRGNAIATLFAVDYAEIRLPLPDRELAYLDATQIPRAGQAAEDAGMTGAPVVLRAEFAGAENEWLGRVVRTEAELDPRSRMVRVVARVADPYGLETERSTPPLAVGLFVDAEIQGRTLESVFVLPRDALRDGNKVYVIDDEDQLTFRSVEVVRVERDRFIISQGLAADERICVSPLQAAIDGMPVRILDDAQQAAQ
ncbi:MAG: efflux RND transporter periplasmic adaptor subunit [Myxococcota bacterium]